MVTLSVAASSLDAANAGAAHGLHAGSGMMATRRREAAEEMAVEMLETKNTG